MSLVSYAPWFVAAIVAMLMVGLFGQQVSAPRDFHSQFSGDSRPKFPRRIHFAWLLLFFAGFALFGSTTPFQFRAYEFSAAVDGMTQQWHNPIVLESRSDWMANLLLSMPLGFFGLAVLHVDRPGWARALWQAALVLPLCICYSTFLEFVQYWLPARTPSNDDIAAQTVGAAIGIAIWMALGQWLTNWAREMFSSRKNGRVQNQLLQAYSVAVFTQALMPFEFSISPKDLWDKYKAGMVVIVPDFSAAFSRTQLSETLGNILMFATIGSLAVNAGKFYRWANRSAMFPLWWAAIWGFGLAAISEFAQLFVDGRFSKSSDVVINTAAAAIGGWITWALLRSQVDSQLMERSQPNSLHPHPALSLRERVLNADFLFVLLRIVPAVLFAVALVVVFTAPFESITDPVRIARRWRNMWEFPFTDSKYWGNPMVVLEDVSRKLIMFGSFTAIVVAALERETDSRVQRRTLQLAAFFGCSVLALGIELLQIRLEHHIADITDVVVAAFGAGLGLVATSILSKRARTTADSPAPLKPNAESAA